MNKNIIDTIYEKMPHMSQTDKKISEVVLRNPQKTVDFTISELSKLAERLPPRSPEPGLRAGA